VSSEHKSGGVPPIEGNGPSGPLANSPSEIVESDDGPFDIGLGDDAPGLFPYRTFGEAVAHADDPPPERPRPRRANPRAHFALEWAAAHQTYANQESLSSHEVHHAP
jgi:hypothetical protein